MLFSRGVRPRVICVFVVFAFSLGALFAGSPAFAQQSVVVPAPPIIDSGNGTTHQAKQDRADPEHAFDATTGQNLVWDRDKKTWVDAKTGENLGFNGVLASDGTVVPAPPIIDSGNGTTHQAKQDRADPEHAFDATTGQNLVWDRDKKTWVDSKTGQSVGFDGVRVPASPPPPVPPEKNKTVSVSTPSQPAPPKPLISMEVGGGVGFNNIGGTSGDRAAFLNSFPGGTFGTSANTFAGDVGSSIGIGPAVFDFNAWRANGSDSKGSGPVLGGGTDTALITQQFQGFSVTAGGKIPLGAKVSLILRGGGNFWHANIDTKETIANGTTSSTVTNSRGVDGRGWTTGAALRVDMSRRWSVVFRWDYIPMSNAGVNVHLNEGSVGVMFRLVGAPRK